MTILDKAIIFATEAHSGMFRKGTDIPYIVHPLEAAAIAATMTVDEEVIAAAVLHDVIEDTPVTKEELIIEFGPRIAGLVCADSENKRADRPAAATWAVRKYETLVHIPFASREEQIIILADKLSNMRSIYRDFIDYGDVLWNKFNVKEKAMHGWYYGGIAERLDKVKDMHAYSEYAGLVDKVFKKCKIEIDKAEIEKWYNEEVGQFKGQLDTDFSEVKCDAEINLTETRRDGELTHGLFKGKEKNDTLKIDHYSWTKDFVYRYFDKEYINGEIEREIKLLMGNEALCVDSDCLQKVLLKLMKSVPYDGNIPSYSEWDDKKKFEQKALETLVKIVAAPDVSTIADALNEVQKKLREAKLFEDKKCAQIYERLYYELTECSVKEFNALKREVKSESK